MTENKDITLQAWHPPHPYESLHHVIWSQDDTEALDLSVHLANQMGFSHVIAVSDHAGYLLHWERAGIPLFVHHELAHVVKRVVALQQTQAPPKLLVLYSHREPLPAEIKQHATFIIEIRELLPPSVPSSSTFTWIPRLCCDYRQFYSSILQPQRADLSDGEIAALLSRLPDSRTFVTAQNLCYIRAPPEPRFRLPPDLLHFQASCLRRA